MSFNVFSVLETYYQLIQGHLLLEKKRSTVDILYLYLSFRSQSNFILIIQYLESMECYFPFKLPISVYSKGSNKNFKYVSRLVWLLSPFFIKYSTKWNEILKLFSNHCEIRKENSSTVEYWIATSFNLW